MKKILIVLTLVAVFFTACDGLQTVSYYPNTYYRPVPQYQYHVNYVPYPHQYYQPYYSQPHYNMPHYGGGHRR